MSNVLLVPVHLDALCLKTDLSVVEAKVDFSRLPYWDGKCEINHDVANISEELLAHPFEDRGLQLKAGVHLHWALPDALTKGVIGENGTRFLAVPDRWLVTRSRKEKDGTERIEHQWIVESDYLYPDDAGALSGSIAIPFPSEKNRPPFRYLGRKMPFSHWAKANKAAATGEYLGELGFRLTAIGYEHRGSPHRLTAQNRGYGEPTFAAFYPNCQSVFGFHDAAPPAALRGVQYDVIGWYSDPQQDCLGADEIDTIKQRLKATEGDVTKEALKEGYRWDITQDATAKGDPEQTIFYASLTIETDTSPSCARRDKPVTIAVGNTSSGALSAYLAHTLAPTGSNTPPSRLEEQLEALHLASRLGHKKLDRGPKLAEARHERGFTAVPAGIIWVIRQATATGSTDASEDIQTETLPSDLGYQLNALNLRQMAYDQAGHELESMQRQLFADWYKYMLCAYPPEDRSDDYPDIDEVRYFIEKNDLLPIKRQQSKRRSLQSECSNLHRQLEATVKEYKERTKKPFELQSRAAPRYWRPHEPVILMVDDEMHPTTRYGQHGRLHPDGLLTCHVKSVSGADISKQLGAIREEIGKLPAAPGDAPPGSHAWYRQPWHPFALEWSVELMPIDEKNNLDKQSRVYAPDFITDNYQLEEDSVDLVLKPGKAAVERAVGIFTGSSILSPHAKFQLVNQIDAFLQKRILPGYYEAKNIPASDWTEKYLAAHRAEVGEWYAALPEEKKDSVVQALLQVFQKLNHPNFHALAQSLSGFNEALLMRKQTLQLPVADPLGFPDAQEFTEEVRKAVGQGNSSAPQPHNDFHPIRTGILRIRALRVVDTFGRVQNLTLKDHKVMATETMTSAANPHLVFLPPRLVQAARLNFRWLAAHDRDAFFGDEAEINTHPVTTPICGWLLPNNLDNSLMVYASSGQALGSISAPDRKWIPAPGTSILPGERWNIHLKKLVTHLLHMHDPTFLEHFLTGIEWALERIDPENFAQHQALAMLMGRPIAVVRAVVNLELGGQPAINQEWNVFRTDIERHLERELAHAHGWANQPAERETDAAERVRFPIRLGDDWQLNDGLVGYWKEQWSKDSESYSYEKDRFYVHACDRAEVPEKTDLSKLSLTAEQKQIISHLLSPGAMVKKHDFLARLPEGEAIWNLLCEKKLISKIERNPHVKYAADSPDLVQAIADPPQKLTMLVDPRGVVHATCGILPTKAIGIPADHYDKALRSLQITFRSGPILTGSGEKVNLPLPAEPGYTWSWVEKNQSAWTENSSIGPASLEATFSEAQAIREGWLKLTKIEE
jgi:hypothetical protein